MSVTKYEENGNTFWRVYVHVRSRKNRKIRAQKNIVGITSEEEAVRLDKKWYQWACGVIAKRENEGLTWGEVIAAWEAWYYRFPSSRWDEGTVRDYVNILHNWTEGWLKKSASGLTMADGFEMIGEARKAGASTQRLYQIKTTVNTLYKWGIGSGKILNKDHSPMFGVELAKRDHEKLPEILNKDEVAQLLDLAHLAEHDWAPVWMVAAYTGMRASELEGLRREDLELVPEEAARALDCSSNTSKRYGMIRVTRQWQKKVGRYGPLKGRYWRTVPISSRLYWYLTEYMSKNDFGSDEHGKRLFPFLTELRRGEQAKVLKVFCASERLRPMKFHTFRACFATHLLAAGVPEIQVMKIGGWRDRETMMIYIRLAGIDEAGATEKLDFSVEKILLKEAVGQGNVVSLFSRK
jgi:integrase